MRNNKIWIFNAGNKFEDNPKYLFIYMNKFRKDIDVYWFTNNLEVITKVKELGFKAYSYSSNNGQNIQKQAGVFVTNQVKEKFPVNLLGATILNLWHGVGCKNIERKLDSGVLLTRVAKKYIKYNYQYTHNQLFLVTSELMEQHFKSQIGLSEEKVIRGGYPRCIYNNKIKTYNHNILKDKGLTSDTKVIMYCPTFREKNLKNSFYKAIPNMQQLLSKLEEKNYLLILKMHPLMEKDNNYIEMKMKYSNSKHLLFWDNNNDIYEILNKIDAAIIDYSSMFYDLLAAGVKSYIRYIYDYDNKDEIRDFAFNYNEMTCGPIVKSFDDLLLELDSIKEVDKSELNRIRKLFWGYSSENSLDTIVDKTLAFTPKEDVEMKSLYSFDIFDTIIQRKTKDPKGIFYYVKDKLLTSGLNFSYYFIKNYPLIRIKAENNVREYYRKSNYKRIKKINEIKFDEIFERINIVYNLSNEQTEFLKLTEIEGELLNCETKPYGVQKIKEILSDGEDVILISDMYLPKYVIVKILANIGEEISKLPLFISNEYGEMKTNGALFLKVYTSLDYKYKEWIHYGDNKVSDFKQPKKLGIKSIKHEITSFNNFENKLIDNLNSYDSYLIATMLLRFREKNPTITSNDLFSYDYFALSIVPYVNWLIEDALIKNFDCLYFLSRDGYYLKIVADEIIKLKKLNIKTKYFYGSRKAWRIPSYINNIDDEFFSYFGNFTGVNTFEKILKASELNEEKFDELCPQFKYFKKTNLINKSDLSKFINYIKYSTEYKNYLLNIASEKRKNLVEYIKQEINFNESFAFIEFWARGYTQDCFTRIINEIDSDIEVPFYYVRSINITEDHSIKYNYTTNNNSLLILESIFGNLPSTTTLGYTCTDNKYYPIYHKNNCDMEIHLTIEKNLKKFCKDYFNLNLLYPKDTERILFDYITNYLNISKNDEILLEVLKKLKYTDTLFAKEIGYAEGYNRKDLILRLKGVPFKEMRKSKEMALNNSSKSIKFIFYKYQKIRKTKIVKKLMRVCKKLSLVL